MPEARFAIGFLKHLLTTVPHDVLKQRKKGFGVWQQEVKSKKKYAAIPHEHGVSHRIKKIGENADVNVIFSVPQTLVTLCKKSYSTTVKRACDIKHKVKFVDYSEGVVYVEPFELWQEVYWADWALPLRTIA